MSVDTAFQPAAASVFPARAKLSPVVAGVDIAPSVFPARAKLSPVVAGVDMIALTALEFRIGCCRANWCRPEVGIDFGAVDGS